MKKAIAVIGAMDIEVGALRAELAEVQEHKTLLDSLSVQTGILAGRNVVLACCGVGKVNASLATQNIIDRFSVQAIINTGAAGGLSPKAVIGDLVIGRQSVQHDVDAACLGYSRGVIPGLKTSLFTADPRLAGIAAHAARRQVGAAKVHQGLIVSGDRFISSASQKNEILKLFPQAICAEMEGAALAQVAQLNRVPHLIVRAISDQADSTAPADFNKYLSEIIPILNGVVKELIAEVKF